MINLVGKMAGYFKRINVDHSLRSERPPAHFLPVHYTGSLSDIGDLSLSGPGWTADIEPSAPTLIEGALKRTIDVGAALTAIFMVSPLLLIAAVMIKLDSPGPVIFRQRRSGLNSNQFDILKLRSMKVLENGPDVKQACRDDPRITRVGRYLRRSSVDELPQLFNVLKGEMSFVGPRPHALAHDYQYESLIPGYALRRRVKPGITGWAQINGLRGETKELEAMVNRVKCDLWYVEHWSIGLDIYILIRTCFEIMRSPAY